MPKVVTDINQNLHFYFTNSEKRQSALSWLCLIEKWLNIKQKQGQPDFEPIDTVIKPAKSGLSRAKEQPCFDIGLDFVQLTTFYGTFYTQT